MELEQILKKDEKFRYQLLSRMLSDVDYYLGHGLRYKKRLWAGDEEEHIEYMREIHNSLSEKPEWLSMEDIDFLETRLNKKKPESLKDFYLKEFYRKEYTEYEIKCNNKYLGYGSVSLVLIKNQEDEYATIYHKSKEIQLLETGGGITFNKGDIKITEETYGGRIETTLFKNVITDILKYFDLKEIRYTKEQYKKSLKEKKDVKFEVGKKYTTGTVMNNQLVLEMEVIKRTDKTITFIHDDEIFRKTIRTDKNGEFIILGDYSMAPVFRAEDVLEKSNINESIDFYENKKYSKIDLKELLKTDSKSILYNEEFEQIFKSESIRNALSYINEKIGLENDLIISILETIFQHTSDSAKSLFQFPSLKIFVDYLEQFGYINSNDYKDEYENVFITIKEDDGTKTKIEIFEDKIPEDIVEGWADIIRNESELLLLEKEFEKNNLEEIILIEKISDTIIFSGSVNDLVESKFFKNNCIIEKTNFKNKLLVWVEESFKKSKLKESKEDKELFEDFMENFFGEDLVEITYNNVEFGNENFYNADVIVNKKFDTEMFSYNLFDYSSGYQNELLPKAWDLTKLLDKRYLNIKTIHFISNLDGREF